MENESQSVSKTDVQRVQGDTPQGYRQGHLFEEPEAQAASGLSAPGAVKKGDAGAAAGEPTAMPESGKKGIINIL